VLFVAACGSSGSSSPDTTVASAPLVADFTFQVQLDSSGPTFCVPSSVDFTDTSTGGPTAWKWTFDDGQILTDQNPHRDTVSYGESVTLTVTRGSATADVTKQLDGPVC
jgi:PKD repeat protein